jgi:hypothetical protein
MQTDVKNSAPVFIRRVSYVIKNKNMCVISECKNFPVFNMLLKPYTPTVISYNRIRLNQPAINSGLYSFIITCWRDSAHAEAGQGGDALTGNCHSSCPVLLRQTRRWVSFRGLLNNVNGYSQRGKALLLVYPFLLWATGRKWRLTANFCVEQNSGRCIALYVRK